MATESRRKDDVYRLTYAPARCHADLDFQEVATLDLQEAEPIGQHTSVAPAPTRHCITEMNKKYSTWLPSTMTKPAFPSLTSCGARFGDERIRSKELLYMS